MTKNISIRLIIFTLILIIIGFIHPQIIKGQELKQEEVLEINLKYQNKAIFVNSITRKSGFLPDYLNQPENGYLMQIFDKNGRELFKVRFNFPLQLISERLPDTEVGGTLQTLEEANKIINSPVFESAQKLTVTDPEGQIALEHNLAVIVNPNQSGLPAKNLPTWIIIASFILVSSLVLFIVKRRRNSIPAE